MIFFAPFAVFARKGFPWSGEFEIRRLAQKFLGVLEDHLVNRRGEMAARPLSAPITAAVPVQAGVALAVGAAALRSPWSAARSGW